MPSYVSVAVPLPIEALTYRVPDGPVPSRGARVLVPVGRRTVTGCVLAVSDVAPAAGYAIKDITEVIDDEPFLPAPVLALAEWVAEYYVCGVGEAIAAATPRFALSESRPALILTETGEAALATASLDAADSALLTLVSGPEPRPWRDIVARAMRAGAGAGNPPEGGSSHEQDVPCGSGFSRIGARHDGPAGRSAGRVTIERQLRRLERGGLLQRVHVLPGGQAGFKTARVAEVTAEGLDSAVDAGLSTKQRETLVAVREGGPSGIALSALVEQGIAADVVSRLARKGLVAFRRVKVERDPFAHLHVDTFHTEREAAKAGVDLTDDQATALDRLKAMAAEGRFRVALLHGVTGSGKTEVYRRLAVAVRDRERQVLILVPEIALTPAVAATFRHTFGDRVAIQHSALSDGERHDQWHRIRHGEIDVVVGTRSAVFAPLSRVGLVIVDEEHDTSYKQEETPRYHGRDVAIVRARDAEALVVLGSATPALETYQNALSGRYELIELSRRVLERPLADVRIVDMRAEYAAEGPDVVLSRALREAVARRLEQREQAIVLLNRRGYATAVFCRQCGNTLECPNCSVSLTVHRAARQARCHYCDFAQRVPEACTGCGAGYVDYVGFGTERVQAEIEQAFPGVTVARVDRDTVRRRGEITRVLSRFARGEIEVLVGTQMLAKGHDFPDVTLVGVISADVGLGLADFRAAERTFQLLTQVAGRAGRGERPGEAIIQTLYPNHYSIRHARAQDYAAFFAEESAYRRSMRYPPAVALVNLSFRGKTMAEARATAGRIVREFGGPVPGAFQVLGPAPAPLERLRGEYRAQCFLKGTDRRAMQQALRRALAAHPELRPSVTVDVDPLNVL